MNIKEKRKDELSSLRIALRELAYQVDPNSSFEEVELQIQDLLNTQIDPAIDDLNRSLSTARWDALGRLGKSSMALSSATFSASMMLSMGAPFNISAAASAIAGIFGSIYEGEIERKKRIDASRWGIIIKLKNLS